MFGIGAGELMIVAIVLLIAVGPGKMPGFMKAVGKGLREFRRASNELRKQSGIDELMREDTLGVRQLQREIARAPAPRRPQRMTSEDRRREQPPEGVDIVDARARAVERRTKKAIEAREAARAEAEKADNGDDSAADVEEGSVREATDDLDELGFDPDLGPIAREDVIDPPRAEPASDVQETEEVAE